MVSDKQSTIRIRNFNCVNQDVKIFYTQQSGDNGIYDLTNDDLRKELLMTTSNWGNNFLDAEGGAWVADGKTLPYSFSAALDCELLGATGVGILTSLTTIVGETIDGFFLRLMEDLAATGLGKTLANASPMGVHIYYVGNTCYLNLIQYTRVFGSSYVPQSFEITTGSLYPQTSFGGTAYPFGWRLSHPDGWRPFIEIISLDIEDYKPCLGCNLISGYQQFLESLLNQDLYIEELRRYSNSPSQVNVPMEFKSFDSDGSQQTLAQTTVIDPYQAQPALTDYSDIILDGQVYAVLEMLAGEFLELRLQYEASGILTYAEITQLDALLKEQGVILDQKEISKQEKKDMIEAYSNFSGFPDKKEKNNKLIIALIVGLIFIIQ
jgi:hypothetical protein